MPVRVIVTGDRNWYCATVADRIVRRLANNYGDELVIVHGAALGVDQAFNHWAARHGVETEPHAANWLEEGPGAGPRRNQKMVDLGAEFCVAVHQNLAGSKGTKDCVRRCLAAGIPVWLVDSEAEDAGARRVTVQDLGGSKH